MIPSQQCPFCPYRCHRRHNLKAHIQRTHKLHKDQANILFSYPSSLT